MKTSLYLVALFFSIAASAQDNRPTTILSGSRTGTENITGNIRTTLPTSVNTDIQTTSASGATGTNSNADVNTIYGRNNDGSSTGTTVTGDRGASDTAPVDDGSAHPGNKSGSWIVTPRGK